MKGTFIILREYYATARTYHFCSMCMHDICPGERYRGLVSVTRGYFSDRKEHEECPIDPDQEDREFMSLFEKTREKEKELQHNQAA